MELKLEALLGAEQALSVLNVTRGLPAVVAYRITKTVKAVSKELTEYEENRKKLCEEYAKKDEDGKPVIKDNVYDIAEEDLKKINEELKKLREETVEIPVKKISLDDINRAELAPVQLESIEFMLDLEED